jgi:hypothetical protein
MDTISKLEEEAKARALKTLELKNAESTARIERLIIDMLRFFDNQVSNLAVMKEELTELIDKNELQHIIPGKARVNKN